MDGDKVEIQLLKLKWAWARTRGRGGTHYRKGGGYLCGVVSISNGVTFLLTDSNKLANVIFIPIEKLNGARNGEKVLVRVLELVAQALQEPCGRGGNHTG